MVTGVLRKEIGMGEQMRRESHVPFAVRCVDRARIIKSMMAWITRRRFVASVIPGRQVILVSLRA